MGDKSHAFNKYLSEKAPKPTSRNGNVKPLYKSQIKYLSFNVTFINRLKKIYENKMNSVKARKSNR